MLLLEPQGGGLKLGGKIGQEKSAGSELLPADQVSLAKEAAASAQSLLLRDIRQHPEYASLQEAYPGLELRDVLAVPMLLKERVIGVIEVVNKRDPVPFNRNDQDLLSAFASQAAIAVENARLYTMTDQELAARLEEMAAMQRLDRELNASLDIDRALRLTLDWALRQSGAEAGWVALHDAGRFLVSTWQGYPDDLSGLDHLDEGGLLLPQGLAPLDEALRSARPVAVYTSRPNNFGWKEDSLKGSGGFLDYSQRALFVPIQRKENVIAMLGLESALGDRWPDHTLILMRRLSDHAAIAIANAQLYAEVEAANLAKSKFVSFVAHELKNPMASIKGYTELVMGGMAGPVNEMQKTFLNTVRSNVDRMNTIVSDLNDLTKIQVGVLRLEYQSVRVDEIIREAAHSMRRQFEEKELLLSLNLPDQLPPAWADPLRVGQILTNLMSNALKYTPAGGSVSVSAGLDSEVGKHQEAARFVRVWVQDTGIGIPPEDQPLIFEQYFRTEISKETAPGTGLGLNITRSLVEMQGGQIWFESQPGHGSTFYFTLPVVE